MRQTSHSRSYTLGTAIVVVFVVGSLAALFCGGTRPAIFRTHDDFRPGDKAYVACPGDGVQASKDEDGIVQLMTSGYSTEASRQLMAQDRLVTCCRGDPVTVVQYYPTYSAVSCSAWGGRVCWIANAHLSR